MIWNNIYRYISVLNNYISIGCGSISVITKNILQIREHNNKNHFFYKQKNK